MKVCNTCKECKPLDQFSKRKSSSDGHSFKCKACHTIYVANHYQQNKDEYIHRAKRDYHKSIPRRKALSKEIRNVACSRCGFSHPAVIDYHHVDPTQKKGLIANMVHSGRAKTYAEIKKCIPLCSNCHRILHWEQRQQFPLDSPTAEWQQFQKL